MAARTLKQALPAWWNNVSGGEDWLAEYLTPRTGAELANVDVQISAGSGHSGFPFQAYEKYWGNLADVDKLTFSGAWGDFHELGHNHQRGWWTFDGDGTWTYEPDYNFTGTETIIYTLRSSVSNEVTFTNTLTVSGDGAFKETWWGISGSYNSSLTGDARYPNDPDGDG